MKRARAVWRWVRRPWPWLVADAGRALGWCWSDLFSWAAERTGRRETRDPFARRLHHTDRASACARVAVRDRTLSCYCGQVWPDRGGAL